jgi:3D-(3,5/4)-trihydroxycyclohexane-1,2-dione acylhydrolase (decyclizing)
MGLKLTIVLLDNGGFGCIERLQSQVGSASFNNLQPQQRPGGVDFVAHARSLGALATKVAGLAQLSEALAAARAAERTSVVVIETDPLASTSAGGHWWDVPVPEVSTRAQVRAARERYLDDRRARDG